MESKCSVSIVYHISCDSWCFKIFCPLLHFFRNPASLDKCSTPRVANFIKERSFLKINSNLHLYFKPVSFLYILQFQKLYSKPSLVFAGVSKRCWSSCPVPPWHSLSLGNVKPLTLAMTLHY